MRLVTAVLCVLSVLLGIIGGLTGGYSLWGQEAMDVAALSSELEKTKAWLLDEIAWSDERCDNLEAALTKAQAELAQARRELARTRAVAEHTSDDVKRDATPPREASEPTRQPPTR